MALSPNKNPSGMGSQVVSLYVGPDKTEFSIHLNLLVSTGPIFADMFRAAKKPTERVTIATESPAALKLFVEYLYTKTVPKVKANMSEIAKGERMRDLCRLYAFVDKFNLNTVVC